MAKDGEDTWVGMKVTESVAQRGEKRASISGGGGELKRKKGGSTWEEKGMTTDLSDEPPRKKRLPGVLPGGKERK